MNTNELHARAREFLALCRRAFDNQLRYDPKRHMVVENYHHTAHKIIDWQGDDTYATRETLFRAIHLALEPDANHGEEIAIMIREVLATQDLRQDSSTYGLFPYYANYGLDRMTLNDYNWAVFNGNSLVELLELGAVPPGELREAMEVSILAAAECIRRRDVVPSYTNIAIHSLPVLVHAGKRVGAYLDNARTKLAALRRQLAIDGGLREYLSSTYYGIDLEGLINLLLVADDPQILADARAILDLVFHDIASHYHHETAQMTGPHARCYCLDMGQGVTQLGAFLHFVLKDGHPAFRNPGGKPRFNLPPLFLLRTFATMPSPLIPAWFVEQINRPDPLPRYLVRGSDQGDTVLHTRFLPPLSVGWINHQDNWEQRNNLLAYWPLGDGRTGHCSEKLLRDSETFAEPYPWVSARFQCREAGLATYRVSYGFTENGGDRHFVDRDEPNRFSRVLVRFSLRDPALGATALSEGSWEFTRPGLSVRIEALTLTGIAGFPPRLRAQRTMDGWTVEAWLYEGPFIAPDWVELAKAGAEFTVAFGQGS